MGVDLIDLFEVSEILKVNLDCRQKTFSMRFSMASTYCDLYHLVQTGARSLENGTCVLTHLVCLISNGTLDELAAGLCGNLTRKEHQAVRLDRLRVWSNG